MFRLLDESREIADAPAAGDLPAGAGRVEFDAVRFSYRLDREILKGVSFTVEPGRTVAIVGPSGAGKSTISRLLFRFYDATGGAVRIHRAHIRPVPQSRVREARALAPQHHLLLHLHLL